MSKTDINEWLRGDGIGKVHSTLQSVIAQSFQEVLGEEKIRKKDLWEAKLMKRWEGRLRGERRVWESHRDHEGDNIFRVFSEQKDQVVWICDVMWWRHFRKCVCFWEGKGLLAGFQTVECEEKIFRREELPKRIWVVKVMGNSHACFSIKVFVFH